MTRKGESAMKISTVLFDLDGTLLPMDQDAFVKAYFGLLAKKLAPHGYKPEELIAAIWSGTKAMIKNTGEKTNEEAFWEDFTGHYGETARKDIGIFDEFYRTDFEGVQGVCGFHPKAAETVALCKAMQLQVVLATNPIFPAVATQARIRWAGLTPEDFSLYTTYENASYCKPNPDYYTQILTRLQLKPEECLMVGNDVTEDMVAQKLGMKVFLLTDCLINTQEKDINAYPNGSFEQLQAFITALNQ